ncbi:MFS transporter [Crenalkalicoccus roseus]|uniref:MFS transporter n=1 Tax=Crenalkalicoccus roseus TaxID=1485588 RepID=UPI001081CC0A|nr:MFS transporter [Crenalkalicoccus roseus]
MSRLGCAFGRNRGNCAESGRIGNDRGGTRAGGWGDALREAPLPRFLLVYVLLFAAYGIEGPFLPALLSERGISPEGIGLLLAAGTAARLVSAPIAASMADRLGVPRAVLAGAILAAGLIGCGFALAGSFVALLIVSVLVSMALAPINPLADSLASRAAVASAGPGGGSRRGFDYGLIRGFGSAAFILGAMAAGPLVAGFGLVSVVWANAGLLLLAGLAVALLPRPGGALPALPRPRRPDAEPGAFRTLLAMPLFRRLLLVTGLVQGSHALYGAFATLRWMEAGIAPEMIGLLWSVAVASEVVMFFLLGRPLLARLGPGGLAAVCAAAGVIRWVVMANTAWLPAQFLIQPLHGFTFAALHLATMRLLAENVPERLSSTAFGVQASLGPGLAGAVLTLAAGPLYGQFGAGGFWAMALLCAIALPASLALAGGGRAGGVLPAAPILAPAAAQAASLSGAAWRSSRSR